MRRFPAELCAVEGLFHARNLRTALIMGSEGEGVSHLLRKESDFAVALPMDPRVESLNVGVACGALSYLYRRQWPRG